MQTQVLADALLMFGDRLLPAGVGVDRLGVGSLLQGGEPQDLAVDLSELERAPGRRRARLGPWYAADPMTIRGERRKGEVLVTVGGAPLDWRSSLAVRNHSPTGPA